MAILMKLFMLLSLIALMQAKMHRIQLHKHPKGIKSMGNILGMQQHTAKKYKFELENVPCAEEVDMVNGTYYSYIFIGTPPQRVQVIFDTALTGISVMDTQYDYTTSKTAIGLEGSYYLENPMNDQSVDATELYSDIVAIDSLFLPNFPVAVFDDSIGTYGRVGLGVTGANADLVGSVIGSLKANGYINSELFSMYIVNETSAAVPEYAGEIIFGGSDANAYIGDLNYVATQPGNHDNFQIAVDSVSVSGKSIAKDFTAIIDTGSDLIGTPILPYALINAKIGGVIDSNGNYFVSCDTVGSLPTVEIVINGQTLTLDSSAYIVQTYDEDGVAKCMSAFYNTNYPHWILGTPVLKNNYFEFDITNQRIGWAPAANYNGPLTVNVPTPSKMPLPKQICN